MKLPLWRLILAILVLGAMAAVLLSLMPVYFENFQLGRYVGELVRSPNATDDSLRTAVIARAHQLDLPVAAQDIQIKRTDGKVELQTRYVVQMDFPLYQVDLHFHANGSSR